MPKEIKKVSIYVKGDRQSTDYYRMYQYFDLMDCIKPQYHQMVPTSLYRRYMPVSTQNIFIKLYIYFVSYFRMLMALMCDAIIVPDIVVIHRRIISKFSPLSFYLFLFVIKKRGSKIIWDFDDNIVQSKELSQRCFNFLSFISDEIVVTHEYLRDLISIRYRSKVQLLPTTDGDMYKYFSEEITKQRKRTFKNSLLLVWLATSSNLKYLEDIVPLIDRAARELKHRDGRDLILKVICDKPLVTECQNLIILNIKWDRKRAIKELLSSHIGIMPLRDDAFTKGKGGFKLIQYMSVGLPCIGSAVGFNIQVISPKSGYLIPASNIEEWIWAIIKLSKLETWLAFSECSFTIWENKFSFKRNLKFWETILSKETKK